MSIHQVFQTRKEKLNQCLVEASCRVLDVYGLWKIDFPSKSRKLFDLILRLFMLQSGIDSSSIQRLYKVCKINKMGELSVSEVCLFFSVQSSQDPKAAELYTSTYTKFYFSLLFILPFCETILEIKHLISALTITAEDRMETTEGPVGTSMPPSPSPPTGGKATLVTVDIVVLVIYFVLVLAVGFWVSKTGLCSTKFTRHHFLISCQIY